MKLRSFFEGVTPAGYYAVAVTPVETPEGEPIFKWLHLAPPLVAGQPIHEPNEDCYCLPKIDMREADGITGTVWVLTHNQRRIPA